MRGTKQLIRFSLFLLLTANHLLAAQGGATLDYSSLIGGGAGDRAQYAYVDASGFIYVVGNTGSSNFPTTQGAFDRTYNGGTQDGFVAKFSPDGRTLVWSTLVGGSLRDQIYAIRVDAQGFVYVVGATGSSNFPVTQGAADTQFDGGSQGTNGFGDAFALKLTPDGSNLVYSTFVGGPGGGEENPRAAMHLASDGSLYMAGYTQSSSFPTTPGAYQRTYGGGAGDGFVVKLSGDGSTLVHGTYFGGNQDDNILEDITSLSDGSIVVSGATTSTNLPPTLASTPGVQSSFAGPGGPRFFDGADGFVARFSEDLSTLVYFTYFGGPAHDDTGAVQVDASGRIIISANTFSSNLGNTNSSVTCGYDRTNDGNRDGFLAIIAADGSRVEACTFMGGSGLEEMTRIRVDANGFIYLTGNTDSGNWPVTADAYQSSIQGGADAMFAVLSPDLSSLVYSTFIGGGGRDRGRGMWLDQSSEVLLSGDTQSGNFPQTLPPFGAPNNGGNQSDAFILRFTAPVGQLTPPENLRIIP